MRASLRTIRNLFMIIILFFILYAYAMFQGGFVSWFLFFSYLPIFLYQFGLLLYPLQDIKVSREFSSATVFAGDTLYVTIEIKRSLPFPLLYCLVEEKLPDSLNKIDIGPEKYQYINHPEQLAVSRSIKKIIFPLFRRQMELTYPLEQISRGQHLLKDIEIQTGDLFGFIKKKVALQTSTSLIVYPAERRLIMKEQAISNQQGVLMTSVWQFHHTNMATGVREYVPGDKYSWIDWKQTAKNNSIMTKEFDQEKSQALLLILDRSNHNHLNPLIFEAAIELTNALIKTVDKENSPVHFLSIGRETKHFSLANENDVNQASRHLAITQPSQQQSFTIELQHAWFSFYGRVNICFILTQLDVSYVEVMKQWVSRSQKIVVFLVQTKNDLYDHETQHLITQLKHIGIRLIMFTEQELVRNHLEVSL